MDTFVSKIKKIRKISEILKNEKNRKCYVCGNQIENKNNEYIDGHTNKTVHICNNCQDSAESY